MMTRSRRFALRVMVAVVALGLLGATAYMVLSGTQNVRDLGVKTAPFFVLVGAKMPAVLIETSFVSNEQEETWLRTGDYRDQLAEAIEIGLQSYIDKRKATVTSNR